MFKKKKKRKSQKKKKKKRANIGKKKKHMNKTSHKYIAKKVENQATRLGQHMQVIINQTRVICVKKKETYIFYLLSNI